MATNKFSVPNPVPVSPPYEMIIKPPGPCAISFNPIVGDDTGRVNKTISDYLTALGYTRTSTGSPGPVVYYRANHLRSAAWAEFVSLGRQFPPTVVKKLNPKIDFFTVKTFPFTDIALSSGWAGAALNGAPIPVGLIPDGVPYTTLSVAPDPLPEGVEDTPEARVAEHWGVINQM